jgi:hypothetical protein
MDFSYDLQFYQDCILSKNIDISIDSRTIYSF